MATQNYKNHGRMVPLYHYALYLILFVCFGLSIWNLSRAMQVNSGRLTAAILLGLSIAGIIGCWYIRSFPLKAQDRAIRAEENFRYYTITGKKMNAKLTMPQIIALRFAPDEELVTLADRAAKENMTPKEIKMAIQNWKADEYRV